MNTQWKAVLYFFMIALCIPLSSLVEGQRVEPISVYRFASVLFYDYNAFTGFLAAIGSNGAVLLLTPEGQWTSSVDPLGLKVVYALEKGYLLLQRGDSLELFNPHEGSKTLYACEGLRVRKVYSKFAIIDCGRPLLLDLYGGKVASLSFDVRPLNTWRHVVAFDLNRFAIVTLTERGWERVDYSLTADVAFSMEGERGVYVILADGGVLLVNPATASAVLLNRVKASPPVATVQINGVEHLVLRDGITIDERGSVGFLQFGVAFMVARDGYFVLTDDGRLLFRERTGDSWLGPLAEFAEGVLAVIPARRYIEAPAVMVARMKGTDLEVLTIGYRNYDLVASLQQGQVHALEEVEVTVEVYRSGGVRGAVLLREGDGIIDRVNFESFDRRASILIRPRSPGCYNVYVEIAPQGYYPSKNVHVGRLCVQARPVTCQLLALQSEVEEGGEATLALRVLDELQGKDVTVDVLAGLPSLVVSHVLPDGIEESMLQPPTSNLRVRLREAGIHSFRISIPPSGPYSGCSTNTVTINVRPAVNVLLIVTVLTSLTLGVIAGVFYMRTRTNIWKGIERAVISGASCSELTARFAGIMPEKDILSACEFVSLYRLISNGINELLTALKPLQMASIAGARDTLSFLESSKERLGACRAFYLRGDVEKALNSLNKLIGDLPRELERFASALEGEKLKLDEERGKFSEYLERLEQYKSSLSTRAYMKLKEEYEHKLKSLETNIENIDNTLKIVKNFINLLQSQNTGSK